MPWSRARGYRASRVPWLRVAGPRLRRGGQTYLAGTSQPPSEAGNLLRDKGVGRGYGPRLPFSATKAKASADNETERT